MMRALGNNRERNYGDVTLKSNTEIPLYVADKARVRLFMTRNRGIHEHDGRKKEEKAGLPRNSLRGAS